MEIPIVKFLNQQKQMKRIDAELIASANVSKVFADEMRRYQAFQKQLLNQQKQIENSVKFLEAITNSPLVKMEGVYKQFAEFGKIRNLIPELSAQSILSTLHSINFPNVIIPRPVDNSIFPLVPEKRRTPSPEADSTTITDEVSEDDSLEGVPTLSLDLVPITSGRKVFIVHGHDHAARDTVAKFVGSWDLKPTILDEQPNKGRTIIDKFEEHAEEAGFAIVLLTGDDLGAPKDQKEKLQPRARQNVILEFGYFLAMLGSKRIGVLYEEGVELPSDIYGLEYIPLDSADGWKLKLGRELKSVGFSVDMNKIR